MSEPANARQSSEPSWGRLGRAVKARALRRHFEGWQLGALSVGIALGFSLVTIPRPSRPDVLPLPRVDPQEQVRTLSRTRTLAERAASEQLPFDVRAVGEAIRRFGSASAAGDHDAAGAARASASQLSARALASHPAELLLRLQALQTRLFVSAVHDWASTGQASQDLRELAGDFTARSEEKGWTLGGSLVIDDAELHVIFKLRWLELTDLRDRAPCSPSLNEWRTYYRLLLRKAARGDADGRRSAEQHLHVVDALARRDPAYEGALARGVLLHQLGAYSEAVQQFRSHLSAHPDGRWRIRAQNYLLSALAGARSGSAAD